VTGTAVEQLLVRFVRTLRRAGLAVPLGSTAVFAQAVAAVGVTDVRRVYWAGRATLVTRREDVAAFDRIFAEVWQGRTPAPTAVRTETVTLVMDADDEAEAPPPEAGDDLVEGPVLTVRFSSHEVLRHKDFAAYSHAEMDEAHRLMADLHLGGALQRSRRRRPSRRQGGQPDVRRTIHQALRTGGETIDRRFTVPDHRPRRVVLLCDVSGSMEPYARAVLRFAQAAVVGRARVEAFALGTRLTRMTRELSSRDPDTALERAGLAVADWSGGTRLGEGLRRFNDEWGARGMARGAVVVILSDGWDRGDPEALAEQMARLHRVAYRVVWVNPLKASPGYEPLARGMAAALPWVDEFVEGHSLASLEELARVIGADRSRRETPS
jgi:uncharacterized protein with von Willebrand factor type A (vWA) domain